MERVKGREVRKRSEVAESEWIQYEVVFFGHGGLCLCPMSVVAWPDDLLVEDIIIPQFMGRSTK